MEGSRRQKTTTVTRMATPRGPSPVTVGTVEACHWGVEENTIGGGGGAGHAQRRTIHVYTCSHRHPGTCSRIQKKPSLHRTLSQPRRIHLSQPKTIDVTASMPVPQICVRTCAGMDVGMYVCTYTYTGMFRRLHMYVYTQRCVSKTAGPIVIVAKRLSSVGARLA